MIKRDSYLNELISRKQNGLIKVITGMRRCGKSFLLFNIFKNYLINNGIDETHIVSFAFDNDEDVDKLDKYFPDEPTRIYEARSKTFTINSKKFRAYINELTNEKDDFYLLLDEIQLLDNFTGTLNAFLRRTNFDVYVTGSNSRMLSTDIITTFRGRGDQIKVRPLSFKEFFKAQKFSFDDCYRDYCLYGGMPFILYRNSEKQKAEYLTNLFQEIYIKDICDRYRIVDQDSFERLINILASSIGSLCSPTSIENSFRSRLKINYHHDTIKKHINFLRDSFLIEEVLRYDVKGKKYIESKAKYYFTDLGLRNARLNFRQIEETHLMENVIYNELVNRGFNVDVGSIEVNERNQNQSLVRKNIEIDFVCNQADKRYYIQSAYLIIDEEKFAQEERPLLKVKDNFKKIIIVRNDVHLHHNENGTLIISLKDFLLNPDSINY